jgi:hypothetical protein
VEEARLVWGEHRSDMALFAATVAVAGKLPRIHKDKEDEDLVGIHIRRKGSDEAEGSYQEVHEDSGEQVLHMGCAGGLRMVDNEGILAVDRTRREEVACTPWPPNLPRDVDGPLAGTSEHVHPELIPWPLPLETADDPSMMMDPLVQKEVLN